MVAAVGPLRPPRRALRRIRGRCRARYAEEGAGLLLGCEGFCGGGRRLFQRRGVPGNLLLELLELLARRPGRGTGMPLTGLASAAGTGTAGRRTGRGPVGRNSRGWGRRDRRRRRRRRRTRCAGGVGLLLRRLQVRPGRRQISLGLGYRKVKIIGVHRRQLLAGRHMITDRNVQRLHGSGGRKPDGGLVLFTDRAADGQFLVDVTAADRCGGIVTGSGRRVRAQCDPGHDRECHSQRDTDDEQPPPATVSGVPFISHEPACLPEPYRSLCPGRIRGSARCSSDRRRGRGFA